MKIVYRKIVVCICAFIAMCFMGLGLAVYNTAKAEETENYYSFKASDFTFKSAQMETVDNYLIRFSYTGTDAETVGTFLKGFSAFKEKNILLKTNDSDIVELLNISPYNSCILAIRINENPASENAKGYKEAAPTNIIIPKNTKFTFSNVINGYTGICLSDTFMLKKTGEDEWELAETIPLSVTINGEVSEEVIEKDGMYTLPSSVATVEDKTFIGWEVGDNVYSAGSSLSTSTFENTDGIEAAYVDYTLDTGASIRYDKDMASSGIRFTAMLGGGASVLNERITGLGVIVIPNDMLGTAEFTLENYGGAGQAKDFYADRSDISYDGNGTFTFRATLISVLEQNYNRAFSARAYLTVEYPTANGTETKYVYSDGIETRSVYDVATLALEDNEKTNTLHSLQKSILETYVNRVVNISYDGSVTTVISAATSPVVTEASVAETGDSITLTLTTTAESFLALTYNGKRIKDFSLEKQSGRLIVTFAKNA